MEHLKRQRKEKRLRMSHFSSAYERHLARPDLTGTVAAMDPNLEVRWGFDRDQAYILPVCTRGLHMYTGTIVRTLGLPYVQRYNRFYFGAVPARCCNCEERQGGWGGGYVIVHGDCWRGKEDLRNWQAKRPSQERTSVRLYSFSRIGGACRPWINISAQPGLVALGLTPS